MSASEPAATKYSETRKGLPQSFTAAHKIDYALCGLIGLFPVLFITSLKLVLLLAVVGLFLSWRQQRGVPFDLGVAFVLCAQFALFFLLNTLLFESWEGNRFNTYAIALEAWIGTLIGLVVLSLYLRTERDIWPAWRDALPIGLLLSFAIMTVFYVSGVQGPRASAWAATTLTPPMWFLALSLLSFAGFEHLSTAQRNLRFALFMLAVLMSFYANARLIFLAWGLAAVVLSFWIVAQRPKGSRLRASLVLIFALFACVAVIVTLDQMGKGYTVSRMLKLWDALRDPSQASEHFIRLKLWAAAWQVASQNIWLGIGQVNEREAIQEISQHSSWFRAHQTYLSYLVGGGILALISGLAFQATPLFAMPRGVPSSWWLAGGGFVAVCALNGLTDSVFQSYTNVQGYCLITLLFLAAARIRTRP